MRGTAAAGDALSSRAANPRWPWALTAAALVVAGSAGSFAMANAIAEDAREHRERSLDEATDAIGAELRALIGRHGDLAVAARSWLAHNVQHPSLQLAEWIADAEVVKRHPELLAVGFVPRVGAATVVELHPATIDPTGWATASSAAADAGVLVHVPPPAASEPHHAVTLTPVYSGGGPAPELGRRQAEFLGSWVAVIDGQQLLTSATRRHDDLVATLTYDAAGPTPPYATGPTADLAETSSAALGDGWSLRVFGTSLGAGIDGSSDAVTLLLAGLAVTLLSASLVYALGTDRSRALRLVGTKIDELRHQALHDALTGLPNRALIHDRLEQMMARGRRHGTVGAVLYIDIDGFKNINDTLGHEVGDHLLRALADRLAASLRNVDTIGRMGGDEFVVLIDGAVSDAAPELVASRLLEVTRQPFFVGGHAKPLHVTISVGVAIGDECTADQLLRDADVALYQAKSAGRNRFELFHPEMQTALCRRVELEFDLRSALANDEFQLVYQPIYNLDDLELLGAEALLRWQHPVLGEVKPEAFIPILEQTGQIVEVGRWVLIEACREVASWRAVTGVATRVSVNVSGRQFDDDSIIDHVKEALSLSGLAPHALTIEMTESAIMRNHTATARRLRAIKELGVHLSIDDFGTGYSSFAYLKEFPIDSLKIDRSFTNAITRSPESQALIRTLVQLGRDLGMKTVAEGVETIEEMDQLRREQVDEAQGYLLARPLHPHIFRTTILRAGANA